MGDTETAIVTVEITVERRHVGEFLRDWRELADKIRETAGIVRAELRMPSDTVLDLTDLED